MSKRVQRLIEEKLKKTFEPVYLKVTNESYKHQVPKDSETHFHLVLVSGSFNQLKRVEQHRLVYEALSQEMKDVVHACSIHTYTPEQWENENVVVEKSPLCVKNKEKSSS